MEKTIHSTRNQRIQGVCRLQDNARTRREVGAFIVEGVRLAEEVLKSNWPVTQVFYTLDLSKRGKGIVRTFHEKGIPVFKVTPEVMELASDTESPQGILMEVPIPQAQFDGVHSFVFIIDQLGDPGNLGTLLRTAVAVGADAVVLTPGSVDPYSPKVVRAATGAHFHIPVGILEWEKIEGICRALTVYLADKEGGSIYWDANFTGTVGLLIGNEAHGASQRARQLVHQTIHIPMPGDTESLNAAVAGSVIAFEVLRQQGAVRGK